MDARIARLGNSTLVLNILGLVIFVVGIILIIGEAMMPGTFIIVPGIALMIVGVLMMAFPTLGFSAATAILFLVAFVLAFIPVFMMYKRISPPGKPTTMSSDALVGRTGHVTRAVSPGNIRGKVRVENTQWSATSDRVIPEKVKIEVERVEGVKLIVRPIEEVPKDDWVEEVLEPE